MGHESRAGFPGVSCRTDLGLRDKVTKGMRNLSQNVFYSNPSFPFEKPLCVLGDGFAWTRYKSRVESQNRKSDVGVSSQRNVASRASRSSERTKHAILQEERKHESSTSYPLSAKLRGSGVYKGSAPFPRSANQYFAERQPLSPRPHNITNAMFKVYVESTHYDPAP